MRALTVPAPGPWITITSFSNGWTALAGHIAPSFRLSGTGNVELRGGLENIAGTAAPSVLFNVPAGFRPSGFVNVPIAVRDPVPLGFFAETIFVDTGGDVSYQGARSDALLAINLDAVKFSLG